MKLNILRMEKNFLDLITGTYEYPTVSTIFNNKD